MLIARLADGHVTMAASQPFPFAAVITVKSATGTVRELNAVFPEGFASREVAVPADTVGFEIAVLPLAKKKLGQDQHHTPPKGYPTDKEDYAVPEYYEYPIDRKHIHAAISYFPKHKWRSGEHKKRAAKRILNRAKKYGVHVSEDSAVAQAAKG